MIRKITAALLVLVGVSHSALAQVAPTEPCGYDLVMKELENKYPGFRQSYDRAYLDAIHPKTVANRKIKIVDTTYSYDTIYTIPVVFHILYNTTAENIHDSLIQNQIEVLNDDYRRLNADTSLTRSIFKSRAGDTRIQFEFASTDPSGNPTNGIVRKYTSKTTFYSNNLNAMKYSADGGNDAWNPNEYLNIWVCDMSFLGQDALLGFAYPPYGHPNWDQQSWVTDPNQGVTLHYKIVGRNNPLATGAVLATSRGGRVAVHEVGHFLGLRHIWGDGAAQVGCSVDDYIFDTPNQAIRSNFDCNYSANTCTDPGDVQYPDMIENYMDYSSHVCQNMFTHQQIAVMRSAISNFRSDLPIKKEIITKARIFDTVEYNEIKLFAAQGQRVIVEQKNTDIPRNLYMDVFDMSGKKVLDNIQMPKNENAVSTALFAPGVYVFRLRDLENKPVVTQMIFISKN